MIYKKSKNIQIIKRIREINYYEKVFKIIYLNQYLPWVVDGFNNSQQNTNRSNTQNNKKIQLDTHLLASGLEMNEKEIS